MSPSVRTVFKHMAILWPKPNIIGLHYLAACLFAWATPVLGAVNQGEVDMVGNESADAGDSPLKTAVTGSVACLASSSTH